MISYLISDAKFWTAVAFVIFIIAIYKPVKSILIEKLDSKIKTIKNNINNAEKVKDEAQEILFKIKQRQSTMKEEISNIEKDAEDKINIMKKEINEKYNKQLIRKNELAKIKIKQLEIEAINEIKVKTIQSTIDSTKNIIINNLNDDNKEKLFKASLSELKQSLKN